MQLHRKDYMPRYMQRKEHPGMQQTCDLDYLEMLDREDHKATAKSGGSLVQLAAPVVQRQALQGVVQREPDMEETQTALPEETREEFAAIVLSEENLELAALFEMFRQISRDVQTIHGVITDVIGAQKNRERRLAQALGREKYYRYEEGRSEGRRFGSFWKGLQNSVFDTRQMFLELISYFGQASAVPTFSLGTWYYFSQLREDTHAETREYYRAYAEPILHHLRGKDAAYQLGYLVEIEEGAALGRMTGIVLEILLTELVGYALFAVGGRVLRVLNRRAWTLRFDIQLSGGRSGQRVKDLVGPPNSVVKGNRGRLYITNESGQVIWDVTTNRIKPVLPGKGFGQYEYGTVPDELVDLVKRAWGE